VRWTDSVLNYLPAVDPARLGEQLTLF